MQEWKELCYEWKIKLIIKSKTLSASKDKKPSKTGKPVCSNHSMLLSKQKGITVCRKNPKVRSTKTTPETSSASPTTGSGLFQQYSFLCAEMPT